MSRMGSVAGFQYRSRGVRSQQQSPCFLHKTRVPYRTLDSSNGGTRSRGCGAWGGGEGRWVQAIVGVEYGGIWPAPRSLAFVGDKTTVIPAFQAIAHLRGSIHPLSTPARRVRAPRNAKRAAPFGAARRIAALMCSSGSGSPSNPRPRSGDRDRSASTSRSSGRRGARSCGPGRRICRRSPPATCR